MSERLKLCVHCETFKPVSKFGPVKKGKDKLNSYCRLCCNEVALNRRLADPEAFRIATRKRTGGKSMHENKSCAAYLGCVVSEKVLSTYFKSIVVAPYGNRDYDFTCLEGFKIDVKSACLTKPNNPTHTEHWVFNIHKNEVPDYFFFLAFNNRKELTPMHLWLIPGKFINDHSGFCITNNAKGLASWSAWERPLDKVITCCERLRDTEELETLRI